MPFEIRQMRDGDADHVVALSLRALTPVPSEHPFLLLDSDDG
jgi:hypothetical protein